MHDSSFRIKVTVCHNSPVVQAGLMTMLGRHPDFDCTQHAGPRLIDVLDARPEVIVADYERGVEWAGAVGGVARHRRPCVLVVTHSDREGDIRAALSAGVQGYLLIDDAAEHFEAGVRTARSSGRVLSPKVASRLAENVAVKALTQREQIVLGLVVEGLCNKSIANRLGISSGTVKSHLRAAFGKLGVESRTQAVAIAHRRGFLRNPMSERSASC